MIPLRDVGGLHPQDADGFLLNDAHPLVFPWSHAVEACRDALIRLEGANLASVYVRGSTSQGTAQFGVSDIDVVGVTRGDRAPVDVGPLETALEARFPFCTGVELVRVKRETLLEGAEAAGVRFALSVLGGRVWGEELPLPRYRPGREIAFYAPTLARRLDYYRADPEDRLRWIAKSVVRAGFDLVMEREGVYSPHLRVCCERIARRYPAWADRFRAAAACAVNPDPAFRPDELASFILSEWHL